MKLAILLLGLPLMGQTPVTMKVGAVTPHRTSTAYRWSVGAVIAGNAADAASSWGLREGNPLLGGRFDSKSGGIKVGIVVGSLLLQRHAIRKDSKLEKVFTIINFSWGAGLAGVAVRNERIR